MLGTDLSVLLVDDDPSVRIIYERGLSQVGFLVRAVADSFAALQWLDSERFDVALIDINLRGPDGLLLAAQVQKRQPGCALVMISANATRDQVIEALRLGVADFLIKPVEIAFLRRAVGQAALRHRSRQGPEASGMLTVGALCLHLEQRTAFWQDLPLQLTQTEYCLLLTLAQRAGHPVPAAELIQHCRGQVVPETEARLLLKPHIANLRRKLAQPDQPPVVLNYRGLGFMLTDSSQRTAKTQH